MSTTPHSSFLVFTAPCPPHPHHKTRELKENATASATICCDVDAPQGHYATEISQLLKDKYCVSPLVGGT